MKKDYSILNVLVIFYGIFVGLNIFFIILFSILSLTPIWMIITQVALQILSAFPVIFLIHLYDYNNDLFRVLKKKNIVDEQDFIDLNKEDNN